MSVRRSNDHRPRRPVRGHSLVDRRETVRRDAGALGAVRLGMEVLL